MVFKGVATSREREVVTQALRDAGPNADAMVDRIARHLQTSGHPDAAERLRDLENEVQGQQA